MIAPSPNITLIYPLPPHDVIANEEEYTSIDNTQIHTKKMRLIIENPPVILPSLGFLLGSQSGNVEDDTNFFGTLAHELTWNLETGKIKERFCVDIWYNAKYYLFIRD